MDSRVPSAAPARLAASRPASNDYTWTKTSADKVAAAVSEWAADRGATSFCHWFQPLAASGVRHGLSGQVQNMMIEFEDDGTAKWKFGGKDLLKGETDGSSYPNGGMRATHTAGGYLSIDPTSPISLRDDCIYIPACFVSWEGHALDEKTPLLRSGEAMSREGVRLLKLLGYSVDSIFSNIGLEQEFFLIPREAYHRRPDLMLAGRTIIGRNAYRGQEMCDHYMVPALARSHARPHARGGPVARVRARGPARGTVGEACRAASAEPRGRTRTRLCPRPRRRPRSRSPRPPSTR